MSQSAPKASPQGSPLWRFSLELYRAPGVADACIRLQDEAGVDVNMLFFLLWNASLKRQFSLADVKAADGVVAAWRETAVIPIRQIRRALKGAPLLPELGRGRGLPHQGSKDWNWKLNVLSMKRSPTSSSPTRRALIPLPLPKLRARTFRLTRIISAKVFRSQRSDTILAAFDAKHG